MKIASDSESYGDMVLRTLEDWYKLMDASTLKEYVVGEYRGEKQPPRVIWALSVFGHGHSAKDALKRGDSERAAYEMMLATHYVMRIEMSERLDKALGILKDDLKTRKDVFKLVFPLLESAAKQKAGLIEYNQFRKEKKEKLAARAHKLRTQNWKQAAIAAELGVSTKTVRRYLRESSPDTHQ